MQEPGVDLRSLFWRTTPVTLRRGDRDASVAELNVRVLAGYGPGSDALKVRRYSRFYALYAFFIPFIYQITHKMTCLTSAILLIRS
jgi:hypothetical protein